MADEQIGHSKLTANYYLQASAEVMQAMLVDEFGLQPQISEAAELIVKALKAGGKVLICGNGGSAGDAQHMAGELVGSFLHRERHAFAAIALSTDTSVLTAIGNDYGFDQVFARQVAALGRDKDVLVCISTSGNSSNVLLAAGTADVIGMPVIGLTGSADSKLSEYLDRMQQTVLRAPSTETPIVQQCHLVIEHCICALVEQAMLE